MQIVGDIYYFKKYLSNNNLQNKLKKKRYFEFSSYFQIILIAYFQIYI